LKCLRVHRAARLLDTTNLAIKDIAGEVGYQDALYLSRVFRQVNEQSPSAFRDRLRRRRADRVDLQATTYRSWQVLHKNA
jgi:transcriptional regulator GlxA family with amidase domain